MIFFTSDEHYGHFNMIKLANRPHLTVEEMDEYLIEKHNQKVGPLDVVWHLGDFGWKAEAGRRAFSKLNGFHHLVRGNHELGSLESLFQSVHDYKEITIEGQEIVLFHYPIRSWNGVFRGSWHLHGHTHNLLPLRPGKYLDVGVDAVGYEPLSFEEVKDYMSRKQIWTEEKGFSNYPAVKTQQV